MPRAASRIAWDWARRHPLLAGGLTVAAVLVVGVVIDALRVRSEVDAASTALTSLSVDQLDGDLVGTIGSATAHLDRADQIADRSPFLSLLSVVPGATRQIDGLRTLTETAADLGETAQQAAEAVDEDLEAAGSEPAARLRLLDTMADELDRIEAEVADIDLAEDRELAWPLGDARAELREALDRLPKRFTEARTRVRTLERVLTGPTRYLVLAGNNAEMRGGAGMPLSGGVLTIQDGDLEFGDFEPTANRWAGPIDPKLVPAEYRTTYRQFRVGQSWLQTAVSPNYPAIAPVYDAMSSAFAFGPVDGVVVVDTVTLRQLLHAIGPVKVDGVRYTAANVDQRLLNENYLRFDTSMEDRAVRQDEQGKVATAIFDALKERDVSIAELTTAMRNAAAGRHLLAFAEDRHVQEIFDEVGASGELDPKGLMITVQNIAADKLDWYIDPSATMRAVRLGGQGGWQVRLSVTVPNPEREGNTAGVESYRPGYDDGVHRALVAVYLPEAASDIRTLDLEYSESGPDPPLLMVGKRIFIEEGSSKSVAIEFKLPRNHPGVTLLPSGRVRPMAVTVNDAITNDAVERWLPFQPPTESSPPSAPIAAAFLALAGAVTLVVGLRRAARPRGAGAVRRPPVASPVVEARVWQLGLALLFAAGATLVVFAAVDSLRPR